ncbi:MAG: hypothetical protein HUU15_17510, partial [Candidatus Brocadiae bacterium]|nr:hypothetical protein [Candidatus Brocadiia bacterium]
CVVGDGAPVRELLVSPDGARAAARTEGRVQFLALADGTPLCSSDFHGALESFSVSPDWTRMLRRAAGSEFFEIDTATGEVVHRYSGHSYGVSSAAYSGDGRRVVSAANDMTAAVWDAEPGAELPLLPAPRDGGTVADFDPDRGLLLVVPPAGGVAVADAATGITARSLRGPRPGGDPPLFLPNGHVILPVADPPDLVIIDGSTGKDLRRLDVLPSRLAAVLPGRGGILGRFKTEGGDTLRVWSLTGDEIGTVGIPQNTHRFALSDDGALILTANSGTQTASLFDVRTGRLLHTLQGHSGYVLGAAFAGPGRCLTTGVDATGRCWDTATGRLVAVLPWPRVEGLRISSSRDGRLAWIFAGREARLYETATGRRISQVDTPVEIEFATWAADGTFAVFVGRDGVTRRRVPTDPLDAGRRALPRDLAPFELNELEVGTAAERAELVRAWVDSHPSATALTRRALLLIREQRFDEALPLLRGALDIYPRQRDALVFIAVAENERAKVREEGSEGRAGCVAEGLAALRLAIEYGLDPAEIGKDEFDVLRADRRWGELPER